MLLFQDPRRQRVDSIAVEDLDRLMQKDLAVIEKFVDKVDRTAGDSHAHARNADVLGDHELVNIPCLHAGGTGVCGRGRQRSRLR